MKLDRISETDIAAYFESNLSADQRDEIERSLAAEPEIIDEFLALYRMSNAIDGHAAGTAPSRLIRNAIALYPKHDGLFDVVLGIAGNVIKVLRYGNGVDLSFSQAAFPLRSAAGMASPLVVIRKTCSDVDAELYFENTGAGLCTIRVLVPEFADMRSNHLRAELILEGRIIASEQLAGGQCAFEGVKPRRYSIMFRKNRKALGNITISITELSRGGP